MDKTNNYKEDLKKRELEYNKIHSKEQALADEIWKFFNKELAFGRIMKLIQEKGYQATYTIYNEIKKSKPKKAVALFLWKVKNEKIIWNKK
ncbi:MAG: hypothetical protein HYW34_02830 [Candidatus Brennerbacteria bacterium]|nr:hypothetical protein [Candidatus Brennerbacteria bacterium]